jgi:GNAT superfamily N-acetyltransferase
MPDWPLELTRATVHGDDLAVIIGLIEEAADWLRTKGTDQWARPWPNLAGRDSRIREAIADGTSWICWDHGAAVATLTADPAADTYWSAEYRAEPAVYVHRLVVSRKYADFGIGAELLDWAGRVARRDHGAQWVRISAWTSNLALHAYYRRQGFSECGFHPDEDGYPSRARFQKSVARIPLAESRLFRQM